MEFGLVSIGAALMAVAGLLAGMQVRAGGLRDVLPGLGGMPGADGRARGRQAVVRRPIDRGLLAVHEALSHALPGHVILLDVPLGRLLAAGDAAHTRAWERQVRDLAVPVVVCSPAGEVVGVAELFGTGLLTEREHDRRRMKERLLESAGIRLVRLRGGRLPDEARLRELFAIDEPGTASGGKRRPHWLRVVK